MIFLQVMGKCENSSYTCFEFSYHNGSQIDNADSVRSDGHQVWLADYATQYELKKMLEHVSNADEFRRALGPLGFAIPVVCFCGQGYASRFDNLCKFCRENTVSRADAKRVNVRHQGDGMSIDQWKVLNGLVKRSEVYI